MGAEADVITAPIPHGFVPLSFIFGSATWPCQRNEERNPGKQPEPPHGLYPLPQSDSRRLRAAIASLWG